MAWNKRTIEADIDKAALLAAYTTAVEHLNSMAANVTSLNLTTAAGCTALLNGLSDLATYQKQALVLLKKHITGEIG